ncbi:aromatic motif membrane protein [Mesomycoplasma ovipneumoniae]|uniref:aromatic motif membrane protein n=1 Tax=Mesomycoplasma ovipneumoniae TaxID=29562 RepID=UPI00083E78C9|nr:aromatic motif membrane protein [Mesomycoplasma ovipneumoniae]
MKKNKKLLFFVNSLTFLSAGFLASCTQASQQVTNYQTKYEKFATNDTVSPEQAQPFLENSIINQLLDKIYEDTDSKEQLINRILTINSENYLDELTFNLSFYNSINNSPSDTIISGFGRGSSNPVLFEKAKFTINELFENNWLWLLKNLNSAVFVRGLANIDQFQQQNDELNIGLRNEALKNSFYQPSSNKFIDIAIVKSPTEIDPETNIETKNYQVFLLNQDNFIFNLTIKKEFKDQKILNLETALSPWIQIYPKFISQKTEKFPLQEYARIISNYRSGVEGVSVQLVEKLIFEENLGGNVLYYTLVDFQKK